MDNWKTALQRGAIGGVTSSLASTAALALMGHREANSPYAPTNAVSHWIYGDRAAHQDAASLRYTLPGYVIHHGSAMFWSVLFVRPSAGPQEYPGHARCRHRSLGRGLFRRLPAHAAPAASRL
jgi:hypothetical protein